MASIVAVTILIAGGLVFPYNYANARTHYKGIIDEPNAHKSSKIIMNLEAEAEKKINQEIHSHSEGDLLKRIDNVE
jgi:uncharacterized protein YpiB (UPF0302 family)